MLTRQHRKTRQQASRPGPSHLISRQRRRLKQMLARWRRRPR